MDANGREPLRFFTDLTGNRVYEGDGVAVAVSAGRYKGLRIGTVSKITGIYNPERGEFDRIRYTVELEATSMYHHSRSKMTYDDPRRVVKIGD